MLAFRGYGMLLGALIISIMTHKIAVSHHKIMIIASLIIAISCILFKFSIQPFYSGLWIFTSSIGYIFVEIYMNICIISLSS